MWCVKILALSALLAVPALAEPEPAKDKATPSPSPAAEKKAKAEEPAFDVPVPEGMPVRGIKIPHRDENGKLLMVFEAEVAQKLDAQRVEMQNLKIDAFDEDGKKVLVQIPHSIFNLETRVLTGDSQSLIRREDFEIIGDTIEFNTKTRNGTVRGNVKMTILTEDNPK